jgi:hypothetical protein
MLRLFKKGHGIEAGSVYHYQYFHLVIVIPLTAPLLSFIWQYYLLHIIRYSLFLLPLLLDIIILKMVEILKKMFEKSIYQFTKCSKKAIKILTCKLN